MTLRRLKSFSFRLIPWSRVCFSTIGNSAVPSKHTEIEEETSQRRESSVASESLSENKNRFNHDRTKEDEASDDEIYKAVNAQCVQHPRTEVSNTIRYLRELGFSNDVILESAPICLYPRSKIEEGLKKIREHELELNKVGLVCGFTQESTNDFKSGTHLPDKRLQLCMYYIEEPVNFRGFDTLLKKKRWKKKKVILKS